MKRRLLTTLCFAAVGLAAFGSTGCRTTYANRDPLTEAFPTVAGTNLDEEAFALPDDLSGEPAVLLLGYVQKSQFDVDRWLLGLLQSELDVRVVEVPAARGWVPSMIRNTIDSGMRSGIPREDWGVVWTLYGSEADELQRLTGNEGPRNARVLLLDAEGQIRWFHDRGYSPGKLLELRDALGSL